MRLLPRLAFAVSWEACLLKVEEGLEHFKRSLLSGMMQNRLCGNGQ